MPWSGLVCRQGEGKYCGAQRLELKTGVKICVKMVLTWRAGDGRFRGEGFCLIRKTRCLPRPAGASCLGCCGELLDEESWLDEMKHTKPPPRSDSPGLWHFVGFEI